MAEFFAIITNFGNAPKAAGRLDVAVDGASGGIAAPDVLFNVFDQNGAQLAEFTVTTKDGFASSSAVATNDLFKLTNGAPGLVRARTVSTASNASAILHQSGSGNRLGLAVAATKRADGSSFGMGRLFSVPVGDVPTPTLLIANVSSGDVSLELFFGAKAADGTGSRGTPRLAPNATFRVDLTDADKFKNVIVNASGAVIVQLVSDDGQRTSAFTCLPSA